MKLARGHYTADDSEVLNPWPSFLAVISYEWLAE